MSSTSATAPNNGNGSTSAAQQAKAAQSPYGRRPGAPGAAAGGDLFANLLDLLSATRDTGPGLALGADEPLELGIDTSGKGDKSGKSKGKAWPGADDNPLGDLMAWSGQPGLGRTAPAAAADAAAPQADGAGAEASGVAGADTGTALDGMTLLEAPLEPDAETLAALSHTAEAGNGPVNRPLPAGARAQMALAAGGVAPSGHATVHTGAAAGTAHGKASAPGAAAPTDGVQFQTQALPATRSTVTLDERFNSGAGLAAGLLTAPAREALETPQGPRDHTLAGAAGAAGGGNAGTAGSDMGGLGAGGDGGSESPAGQSAADTPTDANPYSETADEAASEGMGHWSANNLRQASLSVGGGDDAINIQLSMNGSEVSVDFRTDSAEARAGLQQGGESLSELLARSGIQLGGVSVGAQGGGQSAPQQPGTAAAAGGGRVGRSGTHNGPQVATGPAQPRPPRADGSRPLDLFV
jgi:flagellar hook-length control protein FliK